MGMLDDMVGYHFVGDPQTGTVIVIRSEVLLYERLPRRAAVGDTFSESDMDELLDIAAHQVLDRDE